MIGNRNTTIHLSGSDTLNNARSKDHSHDLAHQPHCRSLQVIEFGFHQWPVECILQNILNPLLETAEETIILERKVHEIDNSETNRKISFIYGFSRFSV